MLCARLVISVYVLDADHSHRYLALQLVVKVWWNRRQKRLESDECYLVLDIMLHMQQLQ